MVDTLLNFVSGLGGWAYAIVFVLVTAESALIFGFLVPGLTLVFFCGFLAGHGQLNPVILAAVVASAAILGNLIGYAFGRRLHRPWVLRHGGRFGLRASHLKAAEALFERHGGKAVLLGRFSPFLRALVPFVAGASHQARRVFVIYSVVGGVVWATGAVMIGYLAGASWRIVERWIGRIGLVSVVVLILVIGAAYGYHRIRRMRKR